MGSPSSKRKPLGTTLKQRAKRNRILPRSLRSPCTSRVKRGLEPRWINENEESGKREVRRVGALVATCDRQDLAGVREIATHMYYYPTCKIHDDKLRKIV